MSKATHARNVFDAPLCGRASGQTVPSFMEPTCKVCQKAKARRFETYVATAREFLAARPIVSSGQIAFAVHGRSSARLADCADVVDVALERSGEFWRMTLLNENIQLWRKA